jgi:hypothetical protein
MVEPAPLNRGGDLRLAQALANQLASRLRLPLLSTVRRLADMLQAARVERQAAIARYKIEFENDIAELQLELDKIKVLLRVLRTLYDFRA